VPEPHAEYASLTLNQLVPIFCVPDSAPVCSGPPRTIINANTALSAMSAKIIIATLSSFMASLRKPLLVVLPGLCCLPVLGSRTTCSSVLVLLRMVCCPFLLFLCLR